jgi:recombination protein RecT
LHGYFAPEPENRRHTLVYGWRRASPARAAATLIMLRQNAGSLEILMTRRSPQARVAPGAWVFPGGTLNTADYDLAARYTIPAAWVPERARPASRIAALRETFEEVGLLLAHSEHHGRLVSGDEVARLNRAPTESLAAQLRRNKWILAWDQLALWSHWVTSQDLPHRFATDFWLALMPRGQNACADGVEQHELRWVRATEALHECAAGRFPMLFPTQRTLMQLAHCHDAHALWQNCMHPDYQAPTFEPRGAWVSGALQRLTHDDPAYGELALVTPDGQVAHSLDWHSTEPRPLRTLVHRCTASNSGVMTGPGTNTYIVGDARGRIIIDPGPALPEHIARLVTHVGSSLQAIICTHGHADHAEAAQPLNQALGGHIPIMGLPARPHPPRHPAFMPTHILHDGECLRLADLTLRIVHTPGHASHHLCLILEEDRLLFSGDHILNGSTSVIEPPDGHMGDYLASLERLRHEAIDFILPAHGYVLGPARRAVENLIAHRRAREQKIMSILHRFGPTHTACLVPRVYDDVPKDRHAIAERSLRAHLLWLAEQGLVCETPEGWSSRIRLINLPDAHSSPPDPRHDP